MMHTVRQVLLKARCMAKMVMRLKEIKPCHEIDELAQEAQYILLETEELEKSAGIKKRASIPS